MTVRRLSLLAKQMACVELSYNLRKNPMTLTITLELSPEMEATLREEIARHDAENIRRLLADALAPTVEALLQQPASPLSDDEFEVVAERLADELASGIKPGTPALSDYAVSRAGIDEDHP